MTENGFIENIAAEAIESLPLASFQGEIVVIDSVGEDYSAAIRYLRRQQVIGFDTETKPCFTPHAPQNKVALLQLSGPGKAYLFRLMNLGMQKELINLLANPRIIKVGASTGDDIRALHRRYHFRPQSFVDLQKIAPVWGIRDKSVKKMAAIILGVKISKTQQLSNWEAEELSEPQQRYAATDAWVCREMYFKLLGTEKKPLSSTTITLETPSPESQMVLPPVIVEESVAVENNLVAFKIEEGLALQAEADAEIMAHREAQAKAKNAAKAVRRKSARHRARKSNQE